MNTPVFCLMGPTASGKTSLALALAEYFPLEIVSIDSALVYREMDIGTAKPSASEQAQVMHHGIDIINPDEIYSAAQCCADVASLVQTIEQREKIPLLVGGSMMYFKALQQGMAALPEADASVRRALSEEAAEHGWPHLHTQLQQIDPVTAARIAPQDQQRIQRALEVYRISGIPLSALQQQTPPPLSARFVNLILLPEDRHWLHTRIKQRFAQMLQEGLIEEVTQLIQRWPDALNKPSMRMLGYRQVLDYFAHQDLDILTEKGNAATRQLAKRQMTWLRHWPTGHILAPDKADPLPQVKNIIRQTLHSAM